MQVRELIRILSVLSEDEKEYSVVFEDKKYGMYVMSDQLRIRSEPRIVSLISRDDPPKE